MIKDNTINKKVIDTLRKRNEDERVNHISSGKLSASILGWPTQWQVLKVLGVPAKDFDDNGVRSMHRGSKIEEEMTADFIDGIVEQQVDVEYRNTVGKIDALVDTKSYEAKVGIIPFEIKSVAEDKFFRIIKAGEPDRSYLFQACLYALALKSPKFGIVITETDAYKTETWIYNTDDYKEKVDDIITKFQDCLSKKTLPAVEFEEKWMSNVKWNKFPEWAELTAEECEEKLKTEFPDAYSKLKRI